jgi:hypothetical protein
MKKTLLLLAILFIASGSGFAQSCNTYIQQLANGDLKFSVNYSSAKNYVEVFVKQNGIQNVAQNIVSSQVVNANGTYTYSYTKPASSFSTGDLITTRFYSYATGQPGLFTPGPAEQVWSEGFYYNQSCKTVYVSTTGSDSNPGTISQPVRKISYGYELAKNNHYSNVKVAAGVYNEGLSGYYTANASLLTLVNGINLLGGYSSDFSQRDLTFTTYVTSFVAPNGGTQYPGPRVISAANITSPTVVEGMEIKNGVSQSFGGGISITNSNQNLIIRNNRIINNYASYQAFGGNIYISNSSSKILNNVITGGFSGLSYNGSDLYLTGNYNGVQAEIAYNLFTRPSSVVLASPANFHDNTYQFATRTADGDLAESETAISEMDIQISDETLVITGAGDNLQVQVADISGKVLLSSGNSTISLNGVQPGMYIIQAVDNVSSQTKKVILK